MSAITAAVGRAATAITKRWYELAAASITGDAEEFGLMFAEKALTAALDVDEITEALAREQWNSLPLVVSGQMELWDDMEVDSERNHFRARCRPFAEAVRRAILGEDS